jgi:hypothetical protein
MIKILITIMEKKSKKRKILIIASKKSKRMTMRIFSPKENNIKRTQQIITKTALIMTIKNCKINKLRKVKTKKRSGFC